MGLTIVLIFGPSVQDLACPKSMDFGVDVVYLVTAVLLSTDIVCQALAHPKSYFKCQCGGKPFKFVLGSFVFWCDLITNSETLRRLNPPSDVPTRDTERSSTTKNDDWPRTYTSRHNLPPTRKTRLATPIFFP
mmetsp:Transcript_64276/g.76083  ORF Transcript_64276/g.76083 Transcript_64276/m.76083 type:complete len:133 (-) Transcript_64276:936-1334(-)